VGFLAKGAPLKTARRERTSEILTVYFGRGGKRLADWQTFIGRGKSRQVPERRWPKTVDA